VGVEGTLTHLTSSHAADQLSPVSLSPPVRITVHAPVVVSSAGALQSPALLLRSGLTHRKIGKHLALHPVIPVIGLYPSHTTDMYRGVGMGVVVYPPSVSSIPSTLPELESPVETIPCHAGQWAAVCPYSNPLAFRILLLQFQHAFQTVSISRDRSCESNCVSIDRDGDYVVNYEVTAKDAKLILQGICAQMKLHVAAGAVSVYCANESYPWYVTSQTEDDHTTPSPALERYLSALVRTGLQKGKNCIYSAHQMGSCRMSADPKQGVVQPSGETWEVDGLYVADSSVFPSSLGINPMLTVAAFGDMIAKNIAIRLGKQKEWEKLSKGESLVTW